MVSTYAFQSQCKVDLADIPTKIETGLDKDGIKEETERLGQRLEELLDLLFYAQRNSLLIVFQGMDTAGKDGSIRNLLNHTHAQSLTVASFKVPTAEELAHDFLWRCHKRTPGVGECVVFNRSHYEDVLVVRVHEIVPKEVWSRRYDTIIDWESALTGDRTIMLKFFLHISKQEQEERLLAREQDVTKAWKLSVGDWKEREHWDAYQVAYAEAIGRCSAPKSPWHVVPADSKKVRDYLVTKAIVDALEPFEEDWLRSLAAVGEKAKAELAAMRGERH